MTTSVPALAPEQTALLVMDFQPGIVGLVPEPERSALVERVAGAVAAVRAAGGTIGYVRVGHTPEETAAIPERNKAFSALAAGGGVPADAPETAVIDELRPQDGDIVVRKTRVGGFSTTDLHRQLAERGVTTLVLAGIASSGVVLSTLRDAADRDYRVLALEDGCADGDAEVHRVLFDKVFPRQADVLDCSRLSDLLPSAG